MRKPSGADPRKRKGLIIVHTGEGKGKSTAAFGLAMRAAGNKMNVFILQFMKGQWKAGERKSIDNLAPYIEIVPMGDGFTWDTENIEQDKATARKAFEIVKEKLNSGKYQMVIFEEINYVLDYKFLPEDEVLFVVRVGSTICRDVELPQGWRVFFQGALGNNQAVAVVVDVREANSIKSFPEDAESARPRRLQ